MHTKKSPGHCQDFEYNTWVSKEIITFFSWCQLQEMILK